MSPYEAAPHIAPDTMLDLVLRLLTPAARQTALEHLESCGACARRLRETAATCERARARAREVLAAHSKTPLVLHPPARAHPRAFPPAIARGLLIAAGLAALAGLFVLRSQLTPTSRAPADLAWLPTPDASVLTRGAGTNAADSLILEGLTAYERRDLARARALLAPVRSSGSMEQVRRVYLAQTLLRLEQHAAALELLRSVDYNRVPEPWRSESRWALRVALEREGNVNAADSLVRVLATEPGSVGDRARAELQRGNP